MRIVRRRQQFERTALVERTGSMRRAKRERRDRREECQLESKIQNRKERRRRSWSAQPMRNQGSRPWKEELGPAGPSERAEMRRAIRKKKMRRKRERKAKTT